MKTLHLNLPKKWYDKILCGDKLEEYREITPYWEARLVDYIRNNSLLFNQPALCNKCSGITYKPFKTITFSNGYAKNRPQFEIELKGIHIGRGELGWGAEYGVDYFILSLGNISGV